MIGVNRRRLIAVRDYGSAILATVVIMLLAVPAVAWLAGVAVQALFPQMPDRWLPTIRAVVRTGLFMTAGFWAGVAIRKGVAWWLGVLHRIWPEREDDR